MRHERFPITDIGSGILAEDALSALSTEFPLKPCLIDHILAGHPLLSFDALAEAAARLDPSHVECRIAASRSGEGFALTAGEGPTATQTIREIGTAGRWVMLRFAEQLPEYASLCDMMLDELAPLTRRFGPALRPRAFIFISSPGTLTPFHFDPEFNVLFQIAGTKDFATCPPYEPWLSADNQLCFHRSGDNLLPWQPDLGDGATVHRLRPGQALYVPYKAPHWVVAGEQPSISLSLTWSCDTTLELEQAWQLTGWLRERGIRLPPPPAFPYRAPLRSLGRSVLGRLGLF